MILTQILIYTIYKTLCGSNLTLVASTLLCTVLSEKLYTP